jgi:ABC-type transport system involved in multi-copper enzyme maturation permease subunit
MSVSTASIARYNSRSDNPTYNTTYANDNIVKNTEYINAKTRELYQMPGTMVDSQKSLYTQTMVAGVMWTVLATGLAYYVFNKL